jgi:hypothetical protein
MDCNDSNKKALHGLVYNIAFKILEKLPAILHS